MEPDHLDEVGSTGAILQSEEPGTLDVMVAIRIEAECWRVLSACSIPEYLEAWLEVPAGATIELCSDLSSQSTICVNLRGFDFKRNIRISRLQAKPDRVTFLWESVESNSGITSLVEILLRDGPRRCTLRLRHSGLRTWDERDLYSTMWRRSLMKLQKLMQSSAQLRCN
jgi:hypothetical protein